MKLVVADTITSIPTNLAVVDTTTSIPTKVAVADTTTSIPTKGAVVDTTMVMKNIIITMAKAAAVQCVSWKMFWVDILTKVGMCMGSIITMMEKVVAAQCASWKIHLLPIMKRKKSRQKKRAENGKLPVKLF